MASNNTYYHTISVGQESGAAYLGPLLQGLSQAAIKISVETEVISRLSQGKVYFHSYMVAGRI